MARLQQPHAGTTIEVIVERIEPQRLFSFRWHPNAVDPGVDDSKEPTTLVVFTLQEQAAGIVLTVTESGFDRIPLERRAQAFTGNERGWTLQLTLIEKSLPVRSVRQRAKLADSAAVFFALGDETQLRLVARLCEAGPASITRLAESFHITRQAVTKNLRVKEDAGLVQRNQHGRESSWRQEPQRLAEARRHLDPISAQWDGALVRLKRFVED